ncbi:MAG TPA: cyclic nucleotide-binding domain-containing protein [Gaiella sp.]|jgi:CRP-like cAMP-binding protein
MALRKNAKVDLLEGVPLFEGCSRRELGEIALVADELDLGKGATLMREGERGREFVVLIEGTARVTRRGRKVRDLGAGDWAGEIALIADVPRTATVTTLTPVRMLVVTDRVFRRLLEQHPSIAAKILQALGKRLAANEKSQGAT